LTKDSPQQLDRPQKRGQGEGVHKKKRKEEKREKGDKGV
jgi:hypothetical protein